MIQGVLAIPFHYYCPVMLNFFNKHMGKKHPFYYLIYFFLRDFFSVIFNYPEPFGLWQVLSYYFRINMLRIVSPAKYRFSACCRFNDR